MSDSKFGKIIVVINMLAHLLAHCMEEFWIVLSAHCQHIATAPVGISISAL
jgi:hypothetical protein